ncbi:unnamed protein product [marine sediment metagenome]|uniref:Flagellar protein FliL n=2 Tax=marine sediment metagenome TaxID=412755 RepID=X1I2U8_9ZZZZ
MALHANRIRIFFEKEEKKKKKEEKKETGKGKIGKIFSLRFLLFWGGIVGAVLVGSYFLVGRITGSSTASSAEEEIITEEAPMGTIYSLDSVTVNLAGEGARRYLGVTFFLELDGAEAMKEIEELKPFLLDSLITLLSSKRLEDIDTIEGKNNLRREIVAQFNERLVRGRVINAYFGKFLIQ